MRVINFVLAAFTFTLGWWTIVGVAAVATIAILFGVLGNFGVPNIIPPGGAIALIIPLTFGAYLGASALDYACHLFRLCVKK